MLLLIVILGALLGWMTVKQQRTEDEKNRNFSEKLTLQHELDSLLSEHDKVKTEYSTLTGQLQFKDSLIMAKADSIRMLIRRQADYYAIRRELNQLREESSVYLHHIDSLYRVTQQLTAENREIRTQYQAEQVKTARLTEEKDYYAEKVAVGSIMKANDIQATAYHLNAGTVRATDKARRTDRIEVCFTIQENLVVETGKKDIYLRITRPDGQVLTLGDEYTFDFNGETIAYSVKQRIRYTNKELSVCMKWDKIDTGAEAMKGSYSFVIITDDYVIGQTQITLK